MLFVNNDLLVNKIDYLSSIGKSHYLKLITLILLQFNFLFTSKPDRKNFHVANYFETNEALTNYNYKLYS